MFDPDPATPPAEFWKRKLAAFLHDPPHKPFRIAGHEDARASALIACDLTVDEMRRWQAQPDWAAAAADRFIFPDPDKSGVRTDWRDDNLAFIHPLAGTRLEPTFLPRTAAVGEDWVNGTLHGIADEAHGYRKNFLRLWRLWRDRAAESPERDALPYLVADTRIPDHTLWQHASIVSAMETCAVGNGDARRLDAAFLLFQIGPVQDFIAQSRKTQDLWSGSYLLSFLIAQGMLAIAEGGRLADGTEVEGVGPDAIIYPLLRGAPLADWHWSRPERPLADAGDLHLDRNELLTPGLPNRFLALLPAANAEKLAQLAKQFIHQRWQEIACAVHGFLQRQIEAEDPNGEFAGWDALWEDQVAAFPQVDCVVHRWADTEAVLAAAAKGQPQPPLHDGWQNHPLHHAALWAKQNIPSGDRDWSCYARGEVGKDIPRIDNAGFAWSLRYAATDWLFAARKNARTFDPWKGFPRPKDALDGRSEVIGPKDEVADFWEFLRTHPVLGEKQAGDDKAERHFVGQQSYGALTIIKRLWARAYLGTKRGDGESQGYFDFDVSNHMRRNFKSVIEVASGKKDSWDETDDQLRLAPEESYYAVLCFDGDEMGKWVSGAKSPVLVGQLSTEARDYFVRHWRSDLAGGLKVQDVQRLLTPSYHAALSEALSNFALHCVRPIVEACDGQLIYCGGDDVLAMLPAAKALACAEALYWTFRGQAPEAEDAEEVFNSPALEVLLGSAKRKGLFEYLPKAKPDVLAGGFINLVSPQEAEPRWPFLVMGPRATASVGIAIGHVRSPMQDTIQGAREAEQRAKKHYGRDAFCLRVLKRSGEALEIGGHWRDTEKEHSNLVPRRMELEQKIREAQRGHPAPSEAAEVRALEEEVFRVTRRHPRLVLLESLLYYLTDEQRGVSGRLPYRLGQLLRPLGLDANLAELTGVIARETERVLARQANGLRERNERAFKSLASHTSSFLDSLPSTARVSDYINVFLAAAWLAKHQPGAATATTPEPAPPELAHA